MADSQAMIAFRKQCQDHYISFTLAICGLDRNVGVIANAAPDPDRDLIVGSGHPDCGN